MKWLTLALTLAAPLSLGLVAARRHAAPRPRAILGAVVIGEPAGALTAGAQARPRAEQLRFVDDRKQRSNRAFVFRPQLQSPSWIDGQTQSRRRKERTQPLPGGR